MILLRVCSWHKSYFNHGKTLGISQGSTTLPQDQARDAEDCNQPASFHLAKTSSRCVHKNNFVYENSRAHKVKSSSFIRRQFRKAVRRNSTYQSRGILLKCDYRCQV